MNKGKVMRALAILEEFAKLNHGEERKFVEEAIAELEALEKGNCEKCKHLETFRQRKGTIGAYCPYFEICKEETHLESYWEAKDD